MKVIPPIRKFIVAAAAGLGVAGAALADGTIDPSEAVQIALAVLGALGVYAVRNDPPV
jgi:hypothetical protein